MDESMRAPDRVRIRITRNSPRTIARLVDERLVLLCAALAALAAPTAVWAPVAIPHELAEITRQQEKWEGERERCKAADRSELSAGSVFCDDCVACPVMVIVPGGTFTMGSEDPDASPVHRVTIPSAFAVGKYEVTREEWGACIRDGVCDEKWWSGGESWVGNPYLPANVSWKEAQASAAWLSLKTGETYRVPSESEWEYAARAGSATAYSRGNTVGQNRANCDGCGDRSQADAGGVAEPAPVGSFAANDFGLHDMPGNVWEWVEDCWRDSYSTTPSDGSAATDDDCSLHVIRGGSWRSEPGALRSAYRDAERDDIDDVLDMRDDIGFRVARNLGGAAGRRTEAPGTATGEAYTANERIEGSRAEMKGLLRRFGGQCGNYC